MTEPEPPNVRRMRLIHYLSAIVAILVVDFTHMRLWSVGATGDWVIRVISLVFCAITFLMALRRVARDWFEHRRSIRTVNLKIAEMNVFSALILEASENPDDIRPRAGMVKHTDGSMTPVRFVETNTPETYIAMKLLEDEPYVHQEGDTIEVDHIAPGQTVVTKTLDGYRNLD